MYCIFSLLGGLYEEDCNYISSSCLSVSPSLSPSSLSLSLSLFQSFCFSGEGKNNQTGGSGGVFPQSVCNVSLSFPAAPLAEVCGRALMNALGWHRLALMNALGWHRLAC